LTVTSALNAIAHAMEALYAPDRNPVIEAMVREAMPAFRDALPVLAKDPQDRDARARGALCCMVLLDRAWPCHDGAAPQAGPCAGRQLRPAPCRNARRPPAPHHRLQRTRRRGPAAPIADTFGGTAGAGLWHFAKSVGAPLRLADLGLKETDLDRAAEIATKNPYANPRPVSRDGIRQLLQQAYDGHCP
jgi:maleylacetate reductase